MKTLVITRYKEDVSWLSFIEGFNIELYNKGPDCPRCNCNITNLKNVGREAQTWCYHIVKNWKNLGDILFLSQAQPFVHSDGFLDRLKENYDKPTPLTNKYLDHWPPPINYKRDLILYFNNHQIRMGDIDYFGDRNIEQNRKWFFKAWDTLFDCPVPEKYYYGYGGMWAVPTEFIYQRDLSFWKFLLHELSDNRVKVPYLKTIDPWSMEALWSAIFTSTTIYPNKKCTIT